MDGFPVAQTAQNGVVLQLLRAVSAAWPDAGPPGGMPATFRTMPAGRT